MTYKIIASQTFEKDFRKLDLHFQSKIKYKFREVAENPTQYKHMHPPMNNYCRISVEKLRIFFSYDVQKQILYLEKIIFGHKY